MSRSIIVFMLTAFMVTGASAEQDISEFKRGPMPVKVDWPEGWDLRPVEYNEVGVSFGQSARLAKDGRVSVANLECFHKDGITADQSILDYLVTGFARAVVGRWKKEGGLEVSPSSPADATLGAYQGRGVELDSKNPAHTFHGEIIMADGPACRLMVMVTHAGGPYSEMKAVFESIKASVK